MKREILKIALGITVSIVIAGAGFAVGNEYGKEKGIIAEQEEIKVSVNTIAVVNMDDGINLNGEQVNYASHLIEFPGENFIQTGLEEAKSGLSSDKYAAYIVIPADFTQDVESIAGNPQKAVIEYDINPDLEESVKADTIYDIWNFQRSLNSNVAYTYVDSILTEFHNVQDDSSKILTNDRNGLAKIQSVNADNLIAAVDFSELKQVEDTVQPLDLGEYYEENATTLSNMATSFEESIAKGVSEFEQVKTAQETVNRNTGTFFEKLGSMDVLTDETGESILAAGNNTLKQETIQMLNEQTKIQQEFVDTDLQQNVDEKLSSIQQQNQEAVQTQLEEIQTKLEDSIGAQKADYQKAVSKKYEDAVNAALSDSGIFSTYQSKVQEEYQQYVDTALAEILQSVKETYEQRLSSVSSDRDTVLDEAETTISTAADSLNISPEQKEALVAAIDTMKMNGGETDFGESGGADGTVVPDVNKIDLNNAAISGIEFEGISLEDVDVSDIPEITVPDVTEMIKLPEAVSPDEEEKDSETQVWIDLSKDMAGNELLLKGTDEEAAGSQVEQWLETNIAEPIENNISEITTEMKADAASLQGNVEDYQQALMDFDPFKYYTDAGLNTYFDDVQTNLLDMQTNIEDYEMKNDDFTKLVAMTADENIMSLQQNMQGASEITARNIEDTISSLQSSSEYAYGQNAGLLEDFTQKLPYTRVGSVSNTQVYDFIVEPLELKSTGEVQQAKNQTINDQKQNMQISWKEIILLTGIILMCVLILLNIIRFKKNCSKDALDDLEK